jgi:hypothetical protein
MHKSDGRLPDDVPVADSSPDEDYASSWQADCDVPLEATPADWQEQQEWVVFDPEFEEPTNKRAGLQLSSCSYRVQRAAKFAGQ